MIGQPCPGCGVIGAGCICPIVRPQEMPTDQLFQPLKDHPSTWEAEAKALRARVEALEAENKTLRHEVADNEITLAEQIGALTPFEADQARAALQQEGGD